MKKLKSLNKAESIAYIGMLSTFAIIISYIETLIPINIGIPGIKLGLPNIVIVLAIYLMDDKAGIIINVIRVLVVGLLFGNAFSMLFSMAGAVVSFIVMILVKKIKRVSMLSVSVCGGVTHNIAQLLLASVVTDTFSISYYMPVMIIGGLITGVVIGIVSMIIYNRCNRLV